MKKHVSINLYGRVQGVGFRYRAKETADQLGIRGYARNMRDGTVYLEAEGEEKPLLDFIDWCRSGSDLAQVDNIEVKDGQVEGYREFLIY